MDLLLIKQFKELVKEVPGFTRIKCSIEIPLNKKNMHDMATAYFSVNKENDNNEFSVIELTKIAHKIREHFKDHRVAVNMKVTDNKNQHIDIGAF